MGQPVASTRLAARLLTQAGPLLPVLLGLGCILAVWWICSLVIPPTFLPGPVAVAVRAARMFTQPYVSGTLLEHIGISLWRVSMGFGLGLLVGVTLGFLIYVSRPLREAIDFLLAILLPLPPFTLIAVFIIWLGLGEAAKIALIFFGVFGRMTIYAAAAFRALPPALFDAALALGADRWRLFWRVRIPAALPDLFIGMRVLLALAWTSVMGAELIAAGEGIGWTIWTAARNLQTDVIFVGIISIATMGAVMDAALAAVAHRVTGGWAARMRGQ
jgi:taurine transport system permease protein